MEKGKWKEQLKQTQPPVFAKARSGYFFKKFTLVLFEVFRALDTFRNVNTSSFKYLQAPWSVCLTMRLCQKQLRCQVVWRPEDTFTFYWGSSSSDALWSPIWCASISLIRRLKRYNEDFRCQTKPGEKVPSPGSVMCVRVDT